VTKASERFARLVAAHLVNVQVISDSVIMLPVQHVVCGLKFERSSTKDTYYVWEMVVPLFSPMMPNLSLNFSERVSFDGHAPTTVLLAGDLAESARQIATKFDAKYRVRLQRLRDVDEFLQEFEPRDFKRPNMLLEFAIAHALIGDEDGARVRLIGILESRIESPILAAVQAIAGRVIAAIDVGHEAVEGMVTSFEVQNVAVHFPGLRTTAEW
jgi:DNA-binding transcriptional regulator YdaS (Cro superfamily)